MHDGLQHHHVRDAIIIQVRQSQTRLTRESATGKTNATGIAIGQYRSCFLEAREGKILVANCESYLVGAPPCVDDNIIHAVAIEVTGVQRTAT